jgi:hypothetical protein
VTMNSGGHCRSFGSGDGCLCFRSLGLTMGSYFRALASLLRECRHVAESSGAGWGTPVSHLTVRRLRRACPAGGTVSLSDVVASMRTEHRSPAVEAGAGNALESS